MTSRVATAAATASVVPFHCVICFEEFNLVERFPVVLPCGHTYVCNCCAKRLKRCMECREPLFMPAPAQPLPKSPPINPRYSRGRSYQHHHQQQHHNQHAPGTPPQNSGHSHSLNQASSEPIPLPLPKNLVLMAMMEAAERQVDVPPPFPIDGTDDHHISDEIRTDDEDEFDLNRIISGMATLSGPCGTYAVRDAEGLAVLPCHPQKGLHGHNRNTNFSSNSNAHSNRQDDHEGQPRDEDGEAHQQQAQEPEQEQVQDQEGELEHPHDEKESDNLVREPFTIVQGQTVQVVDFKDGVAKLARNAGYIVATGSQLVKVGGPMERCCRLEGVVDTLSLRGRDLQLALDENRQIENSLRDKIEMERSKVPNFPVITDPPDVEPAIRPPPSTRHEWSPDADGMKMDLHPQHPLALPNSPRDVVVSEAKDSTGLELVDGTSNENRVLVYSSAGRFPSSPNSIDNSEINQLRPPGNGLPTYRGSSDDDLNAFAYGCGTALFGKNFLNFDQGSEQRGLGLSFDSFEEAQTNTGQQRLTDVAAARVEHHHQPPVHRTTAGESSTQSFMPTTPVLSNSFDTVDFRTGLSGHRGLSKTSPRSTPFARSVRMMSEHRGIGTARGPHTTGTTRGGRSNAHAPAFGPRFASPQDYHLVMHAKK